MRVLLVTLFLGFISLQASAQKKGKVDTTQIVVEGICGMCKDRIEETVNLSKGVKSSTWTQETKTLEVVYKTSKTSPEAIGKALAEAGHDNQYVKADEKQYGKIHKCCRYREMEGH
ncbi:MAG: heavy-metal-associated domain-containing protein [Salibacteraceae bacterium]